MKTLIYLIILMSSLVQYSFGQKGTTVISSHIGGGIGTMFGNVANYYQANGRAPSGNIEFAFNYSGGLQAGYMFSKYVGLATGIVYDRASWEYATAGDRKTKTTSQNRLQIPLFIRFENTNKKKRGGYFFHVGVNVSYLQSIKDRIDGPINATRKDEVRKTSYAAQANMGAFVPINKSIHWIVGMDLQQQITNNYLPPNMKGYLGGITFFTGISARL